VLQVVPCSCQDWFLTRLLLSFSSSRSKEWSLPPIAIVHGSKLKAAHSFGALNTSAFPRPATQCTALCNPHVHSSNYSGVRALFLQVFVCWSSIHFWRASWL
jgi:hypothetical protein